MRTSITRSATTRVPREIPRWLAHAWRPRHAGPMPPPSCLARFSSGLRETLSCRGFALVATSLAALSGTACGDGATEPAPTPNRAPQLNGSIPAQTVAVGETATVSVASYFTDPDGDALTYAAASSDIAIASVVMSSGEVTVTAVAQGVATVTVTATDPGGLAAQQSFAVTVPNRAPEATDTILNLELAVGDSSTFDLGEHFRDPDGDALSYAAASSDIAIASVAVSGSMVTVTAVEQGSATVTVTATDPGGLTAQHGFAVTVPNRAPEAVGRIEDLDVYVDSLAAVDVSAYFADPDGDDLEYGAASSDTTRVTVSVSGSVVAVTGVAVDTATVTVTATDPGGLAAQQSFAVTVPNRAPEVTDTIPDLELAVGDSTTFDLGEHFRDPDGDSPAYAAETSEDGVAAVSLAGATLTVRAVAKGRATVKVTATDPGGLAADQSFDVVVPNRAPIVTDTIPPQTLTVGQTRSWAAPEYFADPDGDTLTLTAGSTDASIVRVLMSGDEFGILAVAPGTATVTVTATDGDGLSATQGFRVTSEAPPPVIITDVEPAVLLEGADATIRGSGFSSVPENNAVLIDGLAASVTAASSTSLSVIVPYSDCLPPRQAELRVTVDSLSDVRTVGVTPRTREDLELPTGQYRYTYAGNGCLYLPGDASRAEYLIGVVSTSEEPSSLTPVTMTSIVGDPTVATDQPMVAASEPLRQAVGNVGSFSSTSPLAAAVPNELQTLAGRESPEGRRDWDRHAEVTEMERNLELVRRLAPTAAAMTHVQQSRTLSASDTLTIFAGGDWTCASRGQVRAVVRRVGNHTVWLDDIDNPSGSFTNSQLAGLDAFYEANVIGVHNKYFGGLSDVDGNGRVMILMTKEVNRLDEELDEENAFAGGGVLFGDLLPSDQCATSNQAEILYARVPDPDSVFGQSWTRQRALDFYPPLLTHEITHLVQANALVFGGADATIWEIEGGATLAEQLVAYRIFGHGSGRNLGFTAFQQGRDWYTLWVAGLASFFGWDWEDPAYRRRIPNAPEACSWMGRPEDGNVGPCKLAVRAVYDVPSMVFRYAMDRWGDDFSGGEQALMRRLTRSPKTGLASLADVSNWRIEQILVDFYIALWLDLNGGDADGMATWDLDDIWSRLPENAQLQPDAKVFAEFRKRWNIRAGSTSYLHWRPRGSPGPTSLRVTSPGRASIPGHISVWALRVR